MKVAGYLALAIAVLLFGIIGYSHLTASLTTAEIDQMLARAERCQTSGIDCNNPPTEKKSIPDGFLAIAGAAFLVAGVALAKRDGVDTIQREELSEPSFFPKVQD